MYNQIKKRWKIAILTVLMIIIYMGNPMKAEAETVSLPIYLRITENHMVYAVPQENQAPIGQLEKNTICIVYAMTDNYWYQIYFQGTVGYISHDHVELYLGGDGSKVTARLNLQGKPLVMAVLGDSITEGVGLQSQEQTYATLLGKKLGAAAVLNYGLGGSCVAGNHPNRFLDRYTGMNRNANLILVFGGTNDYGFDTPLGTYGDRNQDTFYGGVNQLMCGLKQMYPSAEIVFLTPIRRVNDNRKNSYGNTLNQYAQAVIDMARFYNIRVMDLYTPGEINFASQKSTYMRDGIHPSVKAHSILADYIYSHL